MRVPGWRAWAVGAPIAACLWAAGAAASVAWWPSWWAARALEVADRGLARAGHRLIVDEVEVHGDADGSRTGSITLRGVAFLGRRGLAPTVFADALVVEGLRWRPADGGTVSARALRASGVAVRRRAPRNTMGASPVDTFPRWVRVDRLEIDGLDLVADGPDGVVSVTDGSVQVDGAAFAPGLLQWTGHGEARAARVAFGAQALGDVVVDQVEFDGDAVRGRWASRSPAGIQGTVRARGVLDAVPDVAARWTVDAGVWALPGGIVAQGGGMVRVSRTGGVWTGEIDASFSALRIPAPPSVVAPIAQAGWGVEEPDALVIGPGRARLAIAGGSVVVDRAHLADAQGAEVAVDGVIAVEGVDLRVRDGAGPWTLSGDARAVRVR